METFLRYLYSDFIKHRRDAILWVHVLIPLGGIALFLLYYALTSYTPLAKAENFLAAVTVAFPTLIGIVCSMMIEPEEEAGNFQWLLTCPIKSVPFLSMAAMLALLGLGSVLIASFGFSAGFAIFLHQAPLGPGFYFNAALLLWGSNLFLYFLHLLLSLRFGKGVSMGVGIVESLLAALLITGLGDGIWFIIPSAWGLRFLELFNLYSLGELIAADSGLNVGLAACVAGTILMLHFSLFWFLHWEGKKSSE